MSNLVDKVLLSVAPPAAALLIRVINRMLDPAYLGLEELKQLWDNGERVIISAWHDQLFMTAAGYHGPGAKVLTSASKDGELITRTFANFRVDAVRGSSSRGGRAAFKEMLALAEGDFDLAITPDGPRGPRHEAKDGVIQLARLTKRPVVPMAFACSHGHRFSSWDRFLLPFPIGRGVFSFGEPLYFEKGDDPVACKARLQMAMEQNILKTTEYLKKYDLSPV